jgi:miniconductance mechanosensitive channel
MVAAVILTVSLFTGQSPLVLLSGLGVMMALLVLVFQNTILGFVASLQINSNDLIKEGDWIEMPSFEADGQVLNISLHNVTVQNGDKTISVIPTHKFLDTPYRNWRGVQESGGRRIKRAVRIDLNSVRFCDRSMLERFQRIDLIHDHVQELLAGAESRGNGSDLGPENPFDNPLPTNVEVFQAYMLSYLRNRDDIHTDGMVLVVRQLAPAPDGLPLEVYAFAKTTDFAEYEAIQAEIFDHFLAALPQFDLQVFQQPAGADFRVLTAPQ